MEMTVEEEAKMEVLQDISDAADEKGAGSMAVFAMNMHAMMAITEYQTKLEAKSGDLNVGNLIEALENGGFTDDNGTDLTSTITFKQLKNKLVKKAE